ncbi:hypothetical protein CEP52_008043 [Fusarium oligoseptatum]|uniref:Uncharacterized protein n=1 Tax=Fusarium oligoseptatum TaxID=2604345 RepID=A0A428TK65_9HYPO|nr:hypothetical protein CEP52_008043 [Fusarium oligoseptatum]
MTLDPELCWTGRAGIAVVSYCVLYVILAVTLFPMYLSSVRHSSSKSLRDQRGISKHGRSSTTNGSYSL